MTTESNWTTSGLARQRIEDLMAEVAHLRAVVDAVEKLCESPYNPQYVATAELRAALRHQGEAPDA